MASADARKRSIARAANHITRMRAAPALARLIAAYRMGSAWRAARLAKYRHQNIKTRVNSRACAKRRACARRNAKNIAAWRSHSVSRMALSGNFRGISRGALLLA